MSQDLGFIVLVLLFGLGWVFYRPSAQSIAKTEISETKPTKQKESIPPSTPPISPRSLVESKTNGLQLGIDTEMAKIRKEIYDAIINHFLIIMAGWFVGGYVLWKFLIVAAQAKASEHEDRLKAAIEKTERETIAAVEKARNEIGEAIKKGRGEIRTLLETEGKRWQSKEYTVLFIQVGAVFAEILESIEERLSEEQEGGPFELPTGPNLAVREIYLESAIAFCELAYKEVKKREAAIKDIPEDEHNEILRNLARCSNNLAYLIALRNRPSDRERVYELTTYAFQQIQKYQPSHRWEDTYWWIRLRYDDERTHAEQELRNLYSRPGLPRPWQTARLDKLDRWLRKEKQMGMGAPTPIP